MKKIPISTNQENPKYFILWFERSRKGVIRKFVRVYEHEENMNGLLSALSQDPKVYSLQFGIGSPNKNNTSMKVESISTYLIEEIEELEDESLQADDV